MKKLPDRRYYSYQTELAIGNFPFSTTPAHKEVLYALCEIKEAAAYAHMNAGELDEVIGMAIIKASREIRKGKYDDNFPLPGLQGGAGTSIHMNANEVIASLATEVLRKKGLEKIVHPNDHVNKSQSTNDVGPSALKLASIKLTKQLLHTLNEAMQTFEEKQNEFQHITKLGRTHLQDAVPTTLGEVFGSYTATIQRGRTRIESALQYFFEISMGGTAVGNSVNASYAYRQEFYKELKRITKLNIKPAPNLMSQTSSQTDFVFLSQAITAVMADFSKIASDLRLLASGPNGGLGELKLKELQPGSSIMPGKANPILPESVNQAYFYISGSNLTIEMAAQAAQLELGVMIPVIADRLITSLKLSNEVIEAFTTKCVSFIKADEARCKELLENSTAYATLLTPKLGYDHVSKMVKASRTDGNNFQQSLTNTPLPLPNKPQ